MPEGQRAIRSDAVENAVRKLADDKPETFEKITAMMMTGPLSNPIHQKMTEGHINKVLDLAAQHDEREFELAKGKQGIVASNRWFRLGIFVMILFFVAILIVAFKEQHDVLIPLVTGLLAFAGGFGSGWGIGRSGSDHD